MPLIEYLDNPIPRQEDVTVFDRIVGNAAALLLTFVSCRQVFSALGSEMAVQTLESSGIKYHFNEIVDCIKDDSGQDMCPMEKLSLNKSPDEFYRALKERIRGSSSAGRG
jgi:hypothetical protein